MKKIIETSHKVIPIPDPGIALGKALKGGYTVQPPEAGPVCTNNELINIMLEIKKNQYDNIFRKGEAISRQPTW